MAVKTFSAYTGLSASDTNTYLANSGLVYVKSQTIGSGVTSVTVTDAFSSTYDNYVVTVSGGIASAESSINMTLGSKTSGYWGQLMYADWSNTARAYGSKSFTSFVYCGNALTNGLASVITIQNPFLSKETVVLSNHSAAVDVGYFIGRTNDSTSYTSFTLTFGYSVTGGTITVYGYRKA